MKSLSWFIISRLAFDGQLLRLATFNRDDAPALPAVENSSAFSHPRSQLAQTMLPINDETPILPLVHPVLATADSVLLQEASKNEMASAADYRKEIRNCWVRKA